MKRKDSPMDSRLRMIHRGSDSVNQIRSTISNRVASAPPDIEDPEESSQEIDPSSYTADDIISIKKDDTGLALAQEGLHALSGTSIPAIKGRLPKKVEYEDTPRGEDSFVNVFVELLPTSQGHELTEVAKKETTECHIPVKKIKDREIESVPSTYLQRGRLISMTVAVRELDELSAAPDIQSIELADLLKLDVPNAKRSSRPNLRKIRTKESSHKHGEDIIIGIIDVGGIDFAHEDFLDERGKTRVLSIWDQGGEFRPPPEGFSYGSEFTQTMLNRAIAQSKKRGGFPATMYEKQSQMRPSSHGTHVASIAAGNRGVCPKAAIAAVVVDIPVQDEDYDRRRATFSDSSRITHAVEYLLKIAEEAGKPISINISLGTNGGAHDGSSGVSRWLDDALSQPGRAICIAAGNAGQEKGTNEEDIGWIMGRIHTSGRVAARGLVKELEWAVVGNGIVDFSENELEIWYSPQDRFIVSVQPPNESRWFRVEPGEFYQNKRLSDGTVLSIYNELYHRSNGQNTISIYLSPYYDKNNPRGIRAGVWKVRLEGEEVRDGKFHAWIERDDPAEIGRLEGQRFFRFPSFFSEKTNVDSHSISSLGCGNNVISVANLDSLRAKINITSSQGPTRDGRLKPDICAPGTHIQAANGFSNDEEEWVEMSGTSMASPYACGVIGLMLSIAPNLTSAQCAGILQRTSKPLPGADFDWKNDAGFGEIDAKAALEEAANFSTRRKLS